MKTIYDLNIKQIEDYLKPLGHSAYRAKQIFSWLYRKKITDFDEMTDIPAALIQQLKKDFIIMPLKLVDRQVAKDLTTKYLFEFEDGATIETVLMHFAFGESVCVSSEVGCNMGCAFCASGLLKKQRDLTSGEIVAEIMYIQKELEIEGKRVGNVVVMGTGEPFDNYENVMNFCGIINSDLGLAIGARHITISTCGIVPKIREFANEKLQYNLAISLHAPNDEMRRRLMPVDHAYPMDDLMSALKEYSSKNNRKITFEYILLKGVNDRDEDAVQLAELIYGMNAYVNLIPYNEVDENGFKSTQPKAQLRFYDILMKHGVKATLRTKHGEDIDAACGQLRARHERDKRNS